MDDEKIIEQYFMRSDQAIPSTKQKYGNYCHAIAYNILLSHEDADECLNDMYLRAWNSIPPEHPSSLQAFLARIVKNLALNRYRSRKTVKRGSSQIETALSELAECVDMNTDIESEYERKLFTEYIERFLQKYYRINKVIFIQRYWYMMNTSEIAEENNLTKSRVKVTLFRMRKELKKYLQDNDLY